MGDGEKPPPIEVLLYGSYILLSCLLIKTDFVILEESMTVHMERKIAFP
jgi:hypothetical protein